MDSTRDRRAAANDTHYGVEVLCAGWNPLVAASAEPVGVCKGFVADLGSEVEAFLARFYRFQQA
jgi:hypothetical protein